jgi:hypothetical protein
MTYTTKNWTCHDLQVRGDAVPLCVQRHWQVAWRLWNTRPEGYMRAAMVRMRYPCCEETSHMVCRQRDNEVQAFAPQSADESLAEGIRLGTPWRCLQYPASQVLYTLIELS